MVGVDEGWHIARPNFYPAAILDAFGHDARVGNASGTVHAETACLLNAPHATKGGAMFSTDPSCPNCMKNMIAAGIAALYIDHKGFEKYFHKKRMEDFENLTLPLARAAGMRVYKVFRKEERGEEIVSPSHPALKTQDTEHFAACDKLRVYGATLENAPQADDDHTKYTLTLEPLTRLLMTCAAQGLRPDPQSFQSSRLPTARELVNFIGAGYDHMRILDTTTYRDMESVNAYQMLTDHAVLR